MSTLVNCEDCKVSLTLDLVALVLGDCSVCLDCRDEHYDRCDNCSAYEPRGSMVETGRIYVSNANRRVSLSVCSSCIEEDFFECECCEKYYPQGEKKATDRGEDICDCCYEERYFTCDRCEGIFHVDHQNYHSNSGNTYCDYCFEQEQETDLNSPDDWCDCIREYSFNVREALGLMGNPKDRIYFGVELELYCRADDRNEFRDTAESAISSIGSDFAMLKADSSVEPGFEIVTTAASFELQVERWSKFFDSFEGYCSTDSGTGMHVHVSRKRLSQLHIGKILVFINDPRNYDFMVKIAGRHNWEYARLFEKKIADVRNNCPHRYEAINLTKATTIEFRLFKSTLDKATFLHRLEFVKATVDFCRDTSHRELHYSDFLKWLSKRPFPNLKKFLSA